MRHVRLLRSFSWILGLVLCAASFSPAMAGADWPEFRGPSSNGDAGDVSLPLTWSETENVVWKTAIPHLGWSTPVIHEGRIWLTTATEEGNDFFVYCVDAASGRVLHNKKIFHEDAPEPLLNLVNCYASPSPAIEDGRVYVHFGSYGTACLDTTSGEVLWERRDLKCRHFRGPGSSPILFDDLLILSMDGVDVQYLCALDKKTGETVWKTPRTTEWDDFGKDGLPIREGDLRKAFCTPIIVELDGQRRMISLGSSAAYCYDPATGKELWKATLPGHSSSPRPIFDGERLYMGTGYGTTQFWGMYVEPRDGERVAWRMEGKNMPQTPSPILIDGLLYIVSNSGTVTCIEPATGEAVWSQRIGGSFMASPIHAGGKLYFSSIQGKTTVLRTGRVFESLAVNELDEGFMASPAVTGDALILRTKTHLYRIQDK